MSESLQERFRAGDRLALARLITLAARGDKEAETCGRLPRPSQPGRVIAITGSPGVGKSSLIGKLIEHVRTRGDSVAVLACDPQSPYSGGALLGDRFRMSTRPDDDGVFIRSLAAVSGRGAIADHLPLMVRLCLAFGFDVVLIETVGAGQGDIAVRDFVDTVVLLVQPETGDDLQWEKAGIVEAADMVVVHKADLPGADQTADQARAAIELARRPIPVLRVSSKSGEGIEALWQTIATCHAHAPPADARDLLRLAQQTLADRFQAAAAAGHTTLQQLIADFRAGKLAKDEAADAVLMLMERGGEFTGGAN